MILNNKIPNGPLEKKWTNYKSEVPLVSPANKRRLEIIVVGTGLAGASAAASLVKIVLGALTLSQRKGALTQQKTTKMMGIQFIDFSMIPLKEETTDQEKQMYIVLLK